MSATLVIGMGRELTRAEAERVKEIALEMLPEHRGGAAQ